MTYYVDSADSGANPHVNYEPNSLGGLQEATPSGPPYTPFVEGRVVRQAIERVNPYQQAGERYRTIEAWERDDLILNLVTNLEQCNREIQDRMVAHFSQCDPEYGARVAQGLGIEVPANSAAVPAD
jgi:catalase